MVYHLEWQWGLAHRGNFDAVFLNHGYIAVDIFFILSGFVMSMVYLDSPSATSFDWRRFFAHRVARIYPLYCMIILVICAGMAFADNMDVATALGNLLFLQGFYVVENVDGPSWSVSIEIVSYLAFPIIGPIIMRLGLRRALLLAVSAIVPVTVAYLLYRFDASAQRARGPLDIDSLTVALARGLCGFTLGVCAWRIRQILAFWQTRGPRLVAYVEVTAAAMTFVLIAVSAADLLIYLTTAVLLICLSLECGPVSRVLSLRPMHFLGLISFAVYLIHFRMGHLWNLIYSKTGDGTLVSHVAATVGTSVVVMVIATLCYRFIEVPGRVQTRRLLDRITLRKPVRAI